MFSIRYCAIPSRNTHSLTRSLSFALSFRVLIHSSRSGRTVAETVLRNDYRRKLRVIRAPEATNHRELRHMRLPRPQTIVNYDKFAFPLQRPVLNYDTFALPKPRTVVTHSRSRCHDASKERAGFFSRRGYRSGLPIRGVFRLEGLGFRV